MRAGSHGICSRHLFVVVLLLHNLQKGPANPSFHSQFFHCFLGLVVQGGSKEWLVHHNSLQRYLKMDKAPEDSVASAVREGIKCAKEVWKESIALASKTASEGGMMDYDDMLFMPLWLNLPFEKYDAWPEPEVLMGVPCP